MLFISSKLLSSKEANLGTAKGHTSIQNLKKKKKMEEYEEETAVTFNVIEIENVFLFGSH
jgi:hypothetical protein